MVPIGHGSRGTNLGALISPVSARRCQHLGASGPILEGLEGKVFLRHLQAKRDLNADIDTSNRGVDRSHSHAARTSRVYD